MLRQPLVDISLIDIHLENLIFQCCRYHSVKPFHVFSDAKVGTAVTVAGSSTMAVAALAAVTALAIEFVAVSAFVEEDSTTAALTMSTVVRQAEYVPTKVVILGIAKQSDLLCIAIQAWSIITRQTVG